jgi:ABC-type Fe3+-hydroxamate transport system substrate-binding protein
LGPEPSQAQIELMEKLAAAAPDVDIGGWMFTPHAVNSDVSAFGIPVYRSPDQVT